MKRRLVSELNARSYGSRITRLTALEGQINGITASLFSEGVAKVKAAFGEAFTEGYFRTSYDLQCRSGFARDISGIDEKLIEDVLSYRYDGSDFSSRIWKNKNALALNLKNTLTDSLIRGKSAAETASALAKQTDVSFRSAARLVRTETNRFHNEGAMRAYAEAGIEYYEFVVTHDVRTCDECAALDGKRFRLDEKEPGVNFPPLHPNDRCTTVAYDPDWDDKGAVTKLDGGYEEWKRRREEENGVGWVDKQRKKEYNKTADKEQYEKYKEVLGDSIPDSLDEFKWIKENAPDRWSQLKYNYRTVNRYETDGTVSVEKVIKLDNAAWYTKQTGIDLSKVSGKDKRKAKKFSKSGNAAVMELDGQIYFSHSSFEYGDDACTRAYSGKYPIVGVSKNRIFEVFRTEKNFEVEREYDTEAKFLEFVAKQKSPQDKFEVTILSEKHICESCQGVVRQFKEKYPNATVNIVSGKRGYNNDADGGKTWKHRKKVKTNA